jgi:hypothetical protein
MKSLLAIVILALLCQGCSFALIERTPRQRQAKKVPWCTNSPGLPILDGIAAVAYGANSIRIMRDVSGSHQKLEGADAAQVVTQVVLVIAHGVSAIYGVIEQRRCRAARRQFEVDLATPTPAPVPAPSTSD